MKLCERGRIGSMTLRNRIVMPAMGTNLANPDGTVSQHLIDYYAARAEGGVGMVITEVVAPDEGGRCIHCELGGYHESFMPGLSRLARAVQSGGAKCVLQIAHAGAFAVSGITGLQPLAPSGAGCLLTNEIPREATVEEIRDLVRKYAQLAERAKRAGFDGIEIHGAHGYLPLQFLSPYTNRRTDEYGGSFENRLRFPLEVVRAVREAVGRTFPLIYRISGEEYVPGGLTLEETKQAANRLEGEGIDALHVSAGTWDSRLGAFHEAAAGRRPEPAAGLYRGVSTGAWVSPLYAPEGQLIPLAHAIKRVVSLPVIAVNSIPVEMAETALLEGKADFVAMGRGLIADPDLPNKVMEGRLADIRRCLRCNECLGKVLMNQHLYCAINAQAGNERKKIEPAGSRRHVLVIGGGPAGLEAARVAALRGHDVSLWEREDALGGQLRRIARWAPKKNHKALLDWYDRQLARLGVRIVLNRAATEERILEAYPDAVVVAAGATVHAPVMKGADPGSVHLAVDVLDGKATLRKRVVIVGGGLVGCELALKLAEDPAKEITVVEMLDEMAGDLELFSKWTLLGAVAEKGVRTLPGCKVTEVRGGELICRNKDGEEMELPCDDIVVAMGFRSAGEDWENLRTRVPVHVVGDCLGARKIINAIHEGYNTALRI